MGQLQPDRARRASGGNASKPDARRGRLPLTTLDLRRGEHIVSDARNDMDVASLPRKGLGRSSGWTRVLANRRWIGRLRLSLAKRCDQVVDKGSC
jgi:hypothetical protein